MNEQINNGAVRVLRDYTGRGATKARSVIDDNSVTILLSDTLTPGERRLADGGRAEHVLNNRHEFQRLMRDIVTLLWSITVRAFVGPRPV